MIHEWTIAVCPPETQMLYTIADTRIFVHHLWRVKRPRAALPEIIDGHHPRTNGKIIELPYWARTLPIILHEIAHVFCIGMETEEHGPYFVKAVIELYVDYLKLPRDHLIEEAIRFKLL